ncbi:beta-1,4 N-acetylgalactosaminyltransferase 1 [Bombina bombina]|uniref:beta-1,4 N-acetylgalactosaminyltransferase 1 n=1 Tax=Bombina bombina TaxID=8345 RepID=UPI00235A8A02|nr:beta-1,4 N-acetylgalactosaminyltransferase 1 [Bombina bombina]
MRLFKKSMCIFLVALFPFCLLFIHMLMKSDKVVDVLSREVPEDLLNPSLLKAPEKFAHIPLKWKEDILQLLPKNSCKCHVDPTLNFPFRSELIGKPYAVNFIPEMNTSQLEELKRQREHEYKKHRIRIYNPTDKLIIAKANSPLQYPTQGVEVRPLQTILIPERNYNVGNRELLAIKMSLTEWRHWMEGTANTIQILTDHKNLTYSILDRPAQSTGVPAADRRFTDLTIHWQRIRFELRSAISDHHRASIHAFAVVSLSQNFFFFIFLFLVQFQTDEHAATFSIKVRHPTVPKLYNSRYGDSKYNISTLVTIATKTFLRYDKLQNLIDSIRKFYPTITIIIADDSETPQKVKGPFIEQFIMPFGKGWFAGRNLAVSQVTTKYVLWVDDDFIFCPRTKIEKLVDVLEKTTLDMVGGAVREITGYAASFRQKFSVIPGGEEGDCLITQRGYHHAIKGFPNCVVADGVVNFFLARTDKVRQVGFDPRLSRVGHFEFFVDGLGDLHVGSCDDVIVDHASKIQLPWTKTNLQKEYARFRYPKPAEDSTTNIYYFKNYFMCMTGN